MERMLGFLVLLLPAVANAKPARTKPPIDQLRFERHAIAATGDTRVESRTIYLNPYGVVLTPGDNDSRTDASSIVTSPTVINGWDIDVDTWNETVDCMREIYAPFDVTITDEDPGNVPHIEAVFGGSPTDVGLPDNVAGVSPFTTDCAVIENSIVFTFTDVIPDDSRTACEIMAQEVAHSFGLDHEMLASDPMTYLPYYGERTFQNEMASCGEFGDRMCGINGNVCRYQQNSVKLLGQRLGLKGAAPPAGEPTPDGEDDPDVASGVTGCDAGGGSGIALVLLTLRLVFGRSRHRRPRALLQRSGSDCEGGQ